MTATKQRPKRPAITASATAVCPICKKRFAVTGTSALEVSAAYTEWTKQHQHTGNTA